jgi:hypothetical protein
MEKILLPKGLPEIRDEKGKTISYDFDVPVFTPGIESSPLDQIVLSLYLRKGESFVSAPYGLKVVEQPILKFYANQLALKSIAEMQIGSYEDLASFFSGESILVIPPTKEDQTVLQAREQFLQAKDMIKALDKTSPSYHKSLDTAIGLLEDATNSVASLRTKDAVAFYLDYLNEFKSINLPELAKYLDCNRRTVVKSLQITEGGSLQSLGMLAEQFNRQPTLRNSRLVDVFARYFNSLGFKSSAQYCMDTASNTYQKFIGMHPEKTEALSAYASLICLDGMKGDFELVNRHFSDIEKSGLADNDKARLLRLGIAWLGKKEAIQNPLFSYAAAKLGLLNISKYYHPGLLSIIDDRLDQFLSGAGKAAWAPSRVDALEAFLDYSKKTHVESISYGLQNGHLKRMVVYNQEPYFHLAGMHSDKKLNGNKHLAIQEIMPNYFGWVDKFASFFGRDPYVKGRLLDELIHEEMLDSDIDRYLACVTDLHIPPFSADMAPEAMPSRAYSGSKEQRGIRAQLTRPD